MTDSDEFESADEDTTKEKKSVESAAPPVQAPPVQAPPVQGPPVEAPPVQAPPVQAPPVLAPPVQAPPESLEPTALAPSGSPEATPESNAETPEVSASPEGEKKEDYWGWGGWSTWAASSVSNVAHIASKTTQGLSGAMETFEASLGLPTPEDLAREMNEAENKDNEQSGDDEDVSGKETEKDEVYYPGAGLWSGISALSTTGSKMLSSGLEKLEKVSNTAYEALGEQTANNGAGSKIKRRVKDSSKGANLMSVLQEAKQRYEVLEKISSETMRTMAYLFDEKQGLSQLEALDMLSKECANKMRNSRVETNSLFLYIETSLELKSGDSEIIIEHLGAAITDCLKTIKIDLPITKLNQCRFDIAQQLTEMDMSTMDETAKPSDILVSAVLDNSLQSIATFAARSVELFKKIAELSLLKSTLEVDMKTQADTIKFLNEVLCCEIENICEQFEQKLKSTEISKEDINVLYVETSNAVSYVQETLYFFVPILKWIVVKTSSS